MTESRLPLWRYSHRTQWACARDERWYPQECSLIRSKQSCSTYGQDPKRKEHTSAVLMIDSGAYSLHFPMQSTNLRASSSIRRRKSHIYLGETEGRSNSESNPAGREQPVPGLSAPSLDDVGYHRTKWGKLGPLRVASRIQRNKKNAEIGIKWLTAVAFSVLLLSVNRVCLYLNSAFENRMKHFS